MFPDKNEFLQIPELKKEKERLDRFMQHRMVDGEVGDPLFHKKLENLNPDKYLMETMAKNGKTDIPHPTDPKRSLFKDLLKFGEYME